MGHFSIFLYETGMQVGSIYKKYADCIDSCLASSAAYIIELPEGINWKNKLLIVAGVQLLDQHYFDGLCQ